MNRNDWVFVGTRLLGLYLLVKGMIAIPGVLYLMVRSGSLEFGAGLIGEASRCLIGVVLFLGAASIQAWLEQKDRIVAPDGDSVRSRS